MRRRLNQLLPRTLAVLLFMWEFASPVSAQTAHVLTGTGLKKLDVFVGTWRAEATDSANKGKISAVNTIRWSPGGGFLIADQLVTIGGEKSNNLSIYSYDAAADEYTLAVVGVRGREPFTVPVAYRGDTLIYHGAYTNNGHRYYNRTLNIFRTPGEYVYLIQSSEDSVHWDTHGEGRSVKVGRVSLVD